MNRSNYTLSSSVLLHEIAVIYALTWSMNAVVVTGHRALRPQRLHDDRRTSISLKHQQQQQKYQWWKPTCRR